MASGLREFAKRKTVVSAAQVRESVNEQLRDSKVLIKEQLIEPIDYETVVVKNKTLLTNDPHREMLLFPPDDVSQSTLPRRFRTVKCSVPETAVKEANDLLVKEAIKTYTANWNVIHYKYSAYSGTFFNLPKTVKPEPDALPPQVFEVDAEGEGGDDDQSSKRHVNITRKGWLFKGPDSSQETSIITSFTRSFKRRYFYLKQQADTTYVMEFHKDDKRIEPKGIIYLDSAVDVSRSSKRGKTGFEVLMQDKTCYVFAADSETETDEWVNTLKKVIQGNNSFSDFRSNRDSEPSPSRESLRESLEKSNNPELQKYARETDDLLVRQRQEGRQKLFTIYPDIQRASKNAKEAEEPEIEVYREQFGVRFIVCCEHFTTRLQANLADEGKEKLCNPEPFFVTLALYDAKECKKISEDFYYDPNAPEIRSMVPEDLVHANDMLNSVNGHSSSAQPDLYVKDKKWIEYPHLALFSVAKPHSEIYLVARVEKVLQGSVVMATEPYIKTPDTRVGTKTHKSMKTYCAHLGHYRMPFAWAARQVFQPYSLDLETRADFAFYRQDSSKLSEEDMIKHLQDFKKPEKQSKWVPVLASFKVKMFQFRANLQSLRKPVRNVVTSSLMPVKPFPEPPEHNVAREVEEFLPEDGECSHPYVSYVNHLYVYPKQLKYDSQKSFTKARNIACCVELRDSDGEGATAHKCIYGRPEFNIFTTSASAAVSHHCTTPDFIEEIKVALQAQLHERHHLVFTFYHVSCELSKVTTSKKPNIEQVVGYAWFPLLQNGRINGGDQNIRVSMNLPPGYLHHDGITSGKGSLAPDIRWVDGGKQVFRFSLRLVSTTYSKDQHLHNFFSHCQRIGDATSSSSSIDFETSNRLKSLHAVDVCTVVNFLPTMLNQLFRLLTQTQSDDVSQNTVKVLVHVVGCVHDAGKPEILHSYVKYVFLTELVANSTQSSVHEELARHLKATLRPTNTDQLVVAKFMKYSWFFFDVIIKSMAQHLLLTGRIKMARNERFPSSFQMHAKTLIQTLIGHIRQKHKESELETKSCNISLAHFVKSCFTFMDRGYVFGLINLYMENFLPADPRVLHSYKFEFLRTVCNHEHFIQLNLPIMRKSIKNFKEIKHEYTLSDEFRKNHFMVGLLLNEVKMAMNEEKAIRKQAIQTLRNLLAKHAFDDRYATKAHQSRIANLYLPFISVILEHKGRLMGEEGGSSPCNGDLPSGAETPIRQSLISFNSMVSLDNGGSTDTIVPQTRRTLPRDPSVFAMISGQPTSMQSLAIGGPLERQGSNNSLSSNASGQSFDRESKERLSLSHSRAQSLSGPLGLISTPGASSLNLTTISTATNYMYKFEKLDPEEIKDLLICYLHIVKSLSEDVLLTWFQNSSEEDVIDFFNMLELCMKQFKYQGRKRIHSLHLIGDSKRALTLPSKKPPLNIINRSSSAAYSDVVIDPDKGAFHMPSQSEAEVMFRMLLEANLSCEVALIVLDVVSLYTNHFKDQLHFREGENETMQKVFDLYLYFLQTSQSESVHKHAFAALRAFINKFPKVLFQGDALMCGKLCYEILRCCNSRLASTRNEACLLMYLLMRSNFDFSHKKSFTRVHLQVIISVSQLISDIVGGLSNFRFSESLSVINSYANNDKAMARTVFPGEVKDLTKRIRTVLMATAQMKEHQNDPEMLVDLQYSLAKSYASTPELRRTWLESMARIHVKNKDYSEAAHCYIHIAALVAEYLRRREEFPQGCMAFRNISPNVDVEESGMRDDTGMQDVQYTEDNLADLMEECANYMFDAERYELLGEIYRLIIPVYESQRNFQQLGICYERLMTAYKKVVEVTQSKKRLLGNYFKVAMFGQQWFEEEDGKEYVYKEPKVTTLSEICERLKNLYSEKFGPGVVKLIQDSTRVNPQDLDAKFAYIQVTFVTPYFDDKELDERKTEFERTNNLRRFKYETPFTKNGKARGEIDQQFKRRTIITTSHSFPYVKKRLQVVDHRDMELSPIEVAEDEMFSRVAQLRDVIAMKSDVKRLQLKLQGSVSPQVNAGPLAYAEVFLSPDNLSKYPASKVISLKGIFRDFVDVCNTALDLNSRLIDVDQLEYHESLKSNFGLMVGKLNELFGEVLIDEDSRSSSSGHRSSITYFNIISATSNTSNV